MKSKKKDESVVLTESDIAEMKSLGLSEEEIIGIQYANDFCDIVDMLPDDTEAFSKKIEDVFPDNAQGIFDKIGDIAQNDPEFLQQLVAMSEVLSSVTEVAAPSVEKVTLSDIDADKIQERQDKINDILSGINEE